MVGDTTTTMMWIAGVSPLNVVDAYVAAVPALLFFGVIAARQQHALQPITAEPPAGVEVDWSRLGVVAAILLAAIGANVYFNVRYPEVLDHLPVIGLAVWVAIIVTTPVRAGIRIERTPYRIAPRVASCGARCRARRTSTSW